MITDIAALADALHDARATDRRLPLETPGSVEQAYALQRELDAREPSARVGLKIGATLQGALDTLGLEQPFHGVLRAAHHHANGATLALPRAHPVNVETEFVVGLGEALCFEPDGRPVNDVDPARVERVVAAARYVALGFEFVGSRFDMTPPGNGLALTADAAGNVATVLGDPVDGAFRTVDLAAVSATLRINGDTVASGHGRDSLAGHPFAMVAWLLSQPAFASDGAAADTVVFCGTCTGALPVSPGDRLEADAGPLGSVRATLA